MIDQPLHTPEPHGLPPPCTHHPDIDQLGVNCRISPYASVMRGDAVAGRGLFLGDGVMLFRDVRLVLGSLQEHPQAELRLGRKDLEGAEGLEWEIASPAPWHTFETPPHLDATATRIVA